MLKLASVFLYTFIVETVLILIIYRDRKWVFPSFLANICTNPLLNLIVSELMINEVGKCVYAACVAFLEISAVIYEGYIYYYMNDVSRKKAFTTSLAANALSFISGLIYNQLIS